MQEVPGILADTVTALKTEWGLQAPEILSEEAILKLLTLKITEIIQQGPGTFYQLMYRLDISERKLNEITGSEHAAEKIARLVYDRQLEKIKSRQDNRQELGTIDPDLGW